MFQIVWIINFRKETGEKPPSEVGKRTGLELTSQNNICYLKSFVDYINYN